MAFVHKLKNKRRRSVGPKERKDLARLFTTGIYGYLDLVLIGWTLGLLWLGGCALLTKGGWKEKLRAALTDERLLFGGWGGEVRVQAGRSEERRVGKECRL